jgi:hypothetical protein
VLAAWFLLGGIKGRGSPGLPLAGQDELGGSGPWGAGGETPGWRGAYAEKSGSGQNCAFTLLNHERAYKAMLTML